MWFATTLPKGANLGRDWKEKWARCYDEMIRLDRRTDADIAKVVKWARADRFWSGAFLSPLKLRERDKGQIQFFDRFVADMSRATGATAVPAESMGKEEAALFEAYSALARVELRFKTAAMVQRATEFLAQFTIEDLERVIAWFRMMIGQNGISRLSWQWTALLGEAGDNGRALARFQDRLEMAKESLKRGWSYARKWHGNEYRPVPVTFTKGAPMAAAPEPAAPALSKEERDRMAAELFGRLK
jgi:hypothetical protein